MPREESERAQDGEEEEEAKTYRTTDMKCGEGVAGDEHACCEGR